MAKMSKTLLQGFVLKIILLMMLCPSLAFSSARDAQKISIGGATIKKKPAKKEIEEWRASRDKELQAIVQKPTDASRFADLLRVEHMHELVHMSVSKREKKLAVEFYLALIEHAIAQNSDDRSVRRALKFFLDEVFGKHTNPAKRDFVVDVQKLLNNDTRKLVDCLRMKAS